MTTLVPVINPFNGQLQLVRADSAFHLKDAVATSDDLPISGNTENDVRITQDTDLMYTWSISNPSGSLSDWKQIGSATAIDWSAITNKPSSAVADIDDAVSTKHSHANASALNNVSGTNTGDQDLSGKVDKVTGSSLVPDTEISKLSGIEDNADVTDAVNIASSIHGASTKESAFANDDEFPIIDSEVSNVLKRTLWSTVIGNIKSYIDSVSTVFTNKEISDGILTSEFTAGENLVAGDLCYLKSDGKMWKVKADAVATTKGLLAICLETILSADATGTFLLEGKYTTSGLTAGSIYYVSETSGQFTSTKPTTSGACLRKIGVALSTTVLYFEPDENCDTNWSEYSASSTIVGFSSYTVQSIEYKVVGDLCFVNFNLQGNSNSTTTSFTLPHNNTGDTFSGLQFFVINNGILLSNLCKLVMVNGSNVVSLRTDLGTGTWTASGSKASAGQFFYKISKL